MIKNYIITTLRNIRKHKLFSLVNILGLAIGMTGCFLAYSILLHEFGFDKHFKNHDRIHRVITYERQKIDLPDEKNLFATTPLPLAKAIVDEIPDIEAVTNFSKPARRTVEYKGEKTYVDRVSYVNGQFFDVFSCKFLEGNQATALKEPWSIVITQKTANQLFGEESALGKMINVNHQWIPVNGVIANFPSQTHFQTDMLFSMDMNELYKQGWQKKSQYTYIKLKENAQTDVVEGQISGLIQKYFPPFAWETPEPELSNRGTRMQYQLQPISLIHLHSNLQQEIKPGGNLHKLIFISIISLFVLVLACMNFINLKTAQLSHRCKEVGVRYVLGSGKNQLIMQFLVESTLLACLAMIISISSMEIFKSHSHLLYGLQIDFVQFRSIRYLAFIVLFPLVVGLMSGVLPALYFSSFNPMHLFKYHFFQLRNTLSLRKMLIVFQFTVSIGLMICSGIIIKQNQYLSKTTPGLNKENMLVINNVRNPLHHSQVNSFKNALLAHSQISNVSISQIYLTQEICNGQFKPQNSSDFFEIQYDRIDTEFLETYNIQLLDGRNFSQSHADDVSKVLINKAAAEQFGWKNPLGQTLEFKFKNKYYQVIGLMDNFMLHSLHNPIEPFVFFYLNGKIPKWCYISIKIDGSQTEKALSIIQEEWKVRTNAPIQYAFMDDTIASLYISEQELSKTLLFLTVLGIVIANLGLLGLAHFSTEQRTKEIGIRKVVGASVLSILSIVTKDMMWGVIMANLIAWPVAWLAMHHWLQNFAYHTNLTLWPFVLVGLSALTIALLTVSFQVVRAARVNPVESLRYE